MHKKIEEKKERMDEFMARFDAVFSLSVDDGWVNVAFDKDHNGKIETVVRFFDEDGNPLQDEYGSGGVPVHSITKVSEFIKGLSEMRLADYSKDK